MLAPYLLISHLLNNLIVPFYICQATLATGVTRQAVACPPTEDPNEWLAVHSECLHRDVEGCGLQA